MRVRASEAGFAMFSLCQILQCKCQSLRTNTASIRGNHTTRSDAASPGVVWLTTFGSARISLLNFGLGEKEGKGIEFVVDSAGRGLEDRFVWKVRL
jgi:hypothetical protein